MDHDCGIEARAAGVLALALALLLAAAVRRAGTPPRRSRPIDDHATTSDRIEITTARRGLRGPRRQPAGRDGARRRRRRGPHVRARPARPAPIPNWFVFALRNTTDKPIERWLDGRPLRHRRLGRRVAGPRRAPHRGRDAVGRLRARAHQERPRRRVPPHARARPDHHLRRRAGLRPLRAPLPVEGARVRAEERATASCSTASCSASPACWRSS